MKRLLILLIPAIFFYNTISGKLVTELARQPIFNVKHAQHKCFVL